MLLKRPVGTLNIYDNDDDNNIIIALVIYFSSFL